MEWQDAVKLLKPSIVQIITPTGRGTGFLVSHSTTDPMCAVATADHVISDAHDWEQPIRIYYPLSGETLILHHNERAIFQDKPNDTAAVLFIKQKLSLPDTPPELIPEGKSVKVGVEIGWLGFPAVSPSTMCFFSGRISGRIADNQVYLVDGVTINGVSGGPAFVGDNTLFVVGVVSAYIANRATGETLPGLSVIRDVKQFQQLARTFHDVDEARRKEEEERQKIEAIHNQALSDDEGDV